MKGSIRQRSKGSWEVCIDTGRDSATGKRMRHFQTVRGTKREAEQRLAELLVSVGQGSFVKPTRLTLAQFLEEWLKNHVALNCSPRTKASYEMLIRRHIIPELGAMRLSQLEPSHLESFYRREREKGCIHRKGQLSARTVRYCHSILAEALGHAVRMGLIARNVALAANAPRAEHRAMSTLAPEDIPKFLEAAAETPYYAVFYTLLYTGMRRGEALALRWKNVDLGLPSLSVLGSISVVETVYKLNGEYVIKEPKTPHSQRQIALPPSLTLVLGQHRAEQKAQRDLLGKPLTENDLVFSHPDGTPLCPSTISHAFANIIRKAGLLHIRLHDLRHSYATLMLKAGVHPKVVSEALGHSSISVTLDTYSHVLPGIQEAAAQRFDDFLSVRGIGNGNVGKMSAKRSDLAVGVRGFEPPTT